MATEGTIISHQHDNGRWCLLSADHKEWIVWRWEDREVPSSSSKCLMDHPVAEELRFNLETGERIKSDRGEFGFPAYGVGHGAPPPGLLNQDLVTHPPSWDVGPAKLLEFSSPSPLSSWPGVSTALARRIVDRHLPEALDHFLKRNAEYGDDDDFNLGVAGQYVDISRKVQKLKRRWWDQDDPRPLMESEESDKVIVMELIGHLLMSLDYLEARGETPRDKGEAP